jgi:membrane-bound ClpP family serine protease
MELHLKIIGISLMLLALLHFSFPKYFNWKQELHALSIINRQLMYVHAFFIAFGIFLMGLLCLTSANEIMNTVLGKKIAIGLAIFWGVRLIVQFFGYSSNTWKGKRFETIVHVLFSLYWCYITAIFILASIT